MVLALMRRSHPLAWWTPRQLRAHVLDMYGEDCEAITSRIRELRQRGWQIECRKIKGAKAYEYRLKEKA